MLKIKIDSDRKYINIEICSTKSTWKDSKESIKAMLNLENVFDFLCCNIELFKIYFILGKTLNFPSKTLNFEVHCLDHVNFNQLNVI